MSIKIIHYGNPSFTGDGNKKLACFKGRGRVKLGYRNKDRDTSMGIFTINCPLCIDAVIEKRQEEINKLRILRQVHSENIGVCQKGLKRNLRGRWNEFQVDPEIMERLRAETRPGQG